MPKPKQFSIRAMNVWTSGDRIDVNYRCCRTGNRFNHFYPYYGAHNSPQSKPEELTILAQPATLFSTIVTVVDM